jgi:hypothetical protein
MGERAFEAPAGDDDLRAMARELRDALRAGAIGFTTSRSPSHETPDRRPVASRVATWDEVRHLCAVMGEAGGGIFEIAGEAAGRTADDPDGLRDYHRRLRDLAVDTGVPVTWGLFSRREAPGIWRRYVELLEETAGATSARPSARSPAPPRTSGSSSWTPPRGRTARWPRWRASAASIPSRP